MLRHHGKTTLILHRLLHFCFIVDALRLDTCTATQESADGVRRTLSSRMKTCDTHEAGVQPARLGNSAWAFGPGIPWGRMYLHRTHTSGTPTGRSFGAVDRRESGGGPLGSRWWVVSQKMKRLYRCTRSKGDKRIWDRRNGNNESRLRDPRKRLNPKAKREGKPLWRFLFTLSRNGSLLRTPHCVLITLPRSHSHHPIKYVSNLSLQYTHSCGLCESAGVTGPMQNGVEKRASNGRTTSTPCRTTRLVSAVCQTPRAQCGALTVAKATSGVYKQRPGDRAQYARTQPLYRSTQYADRALWSARMAGVSHRAPSDHSP